MTDRVTESDVENNPWVGILAFTLYLGALVWIRIHKSLPPLPLYCMECRLHFNEEKNIYDTESMTQRDRKSVRESVRESDRER